MEFYMAAKSDVGKVKKINQDSYCMKSAATAIGNLVMTVICDGMGGLKKGEVASSRVMLAFQNWFDNRLPKLIGNFRIELVKEEWASLVAQENCGILDFSRQQNLRMGTTLTAVLFVDKYLLLCCHVGDSRLYRIEETITQLTKDHTWVAREVRENRLTLEEARVHPNRNMLLQCIGVTPQVQADYFVQPLAPEETYLLCSDGFRHRISAEEIAVFLSPERLTGEEEISSRIEEMIQINMCRGERDNITAIVIKTKDS